MSRYGTEKNGSYGLPVRTDNVCGELKKHKKYLKEALKVELVKLKDFIDLTRNTDMNYEIRQQVAGSFAIRISSIEEELKEHKKPKKKVKKSKK